MAATGTWGVPACPYFSAEAGSNRMGPQSRDVKHDGSCHSAGAALIAALAAGALALAGCLAAPAEAQAAASQCVACHTDAAKLKALTPPDPPAAEEGEG